MAATVLNAKYTINKLRSMALAAHIQHSNRLTKDDAFKKLRELKVIKPDDEFKDELAVYDNKLKNLDKE